MLWRAMQHAWPWYSGSSTPSAKTPAKLPRSESREPIRVPAGTDKSSRSGSLAFASLWLMVFAMPWEDAFTIPGFGTSVRLIGMVAFALGVFTVLERGKIRQPALGHVIMILFVMMAGLSFLWSLYPEGTLIEAFSYAQLLTMVWLIWELAPDLQKQMHLMRAYVLGTFVSAIDTVYLFLAHQESAYQRYAGAKLDANDLGLIMALSVPMSYYLLIHSKCAPSSRPGRMVTSSATMSLTPRAVNNATI